MKKFKVESNGKTLLFCEAERYDDVNRYIARKGYYPAKIEEISESELNNHYAIQEAKSWIKMGYTEEQAKGMAGVNPSVSLTESKEPDQEPNENVKRWMEMGYSKEQAEIAEAGRTGENKLPFITIDRQETPGSPSTGRNIKERRTNLKG